MLLYVFTGGAAQFSSYSGVASPSCIERGDVFVWGVPRADRGLLPSG